MDLNKLPLSQQQLADLIIAANTISGIMNTSAMSQPEGRLMNKKVTQRSDGRYMAKIKDRDNKYKYFYGNTELEVLNKIKEFEHKQKTEDEASSEVQTLNDYLEYWLKKYYYENVGDTTYDRQESVFLCQIKPHKIGGLKLYLVTTDDIQSFINEKITAQYSSSHLDKIVQVLRGAFEQAKASNYISINPMLGIKYSKKKLNRDKKRKELENAELGISKSKVFTNDEIAKIKKCIEEAWSKYKYYLYSPAIIFQLKTIERVGELLGLTWADIDFEKRNVVIKKGVVRVKERDENLNYTGKKQSRINPPKTEAGNRTIELCQDAIDALLELKRRYAQLGIDSKYVVCTLNGTHESERNYNRTIEAVCRRAKVDYKSSHTLRSTGITSLVNNKDIPYTEVQGIAGHENIRTTMGYVKKVNNSLEEINRNALQKI